MQSLIMAIKIHLNIPFSKAQLPYFDGFFSIFLDWIFVLNLSTFKTKWLLNYYLFEYSNFDDLNDFRISYLYTKFSAFLRQAPHLM